MVTILTNNYKTVTYLLNYTMEYIYYTIHYHKLTIRYKITLSLNNKL